MRYIAALDYEHLDNGVFLSSLASAISQQQDVRSFIVHGDSAYTKRVIQTGVMREQAKIRSIKDLNHRLIALFADQGVSAIGINGYQRNFISYTNGNLDMDISFFESLPAQPVLLISTLVWDEASESPVAVPLAEMASFLTSELQAESIFAFSKADKNEIFVSEKPQKMNWANMPAEFADEHLPEEFQQFKKPLHLTTARDFHQPFKESNSVIIR
ncbi:MAG: hypothetical protein JXR26_03875 [Balneolaceae bacterium]|nr:hypothetical protein [Balneolaceae bacterium]